LSEQLKRAVENIISAGYQLSREAFQLLEASQDTEQLDSVTKEILNKVGQTTPRPFVITRELVEEILAKYLPERELATPTLEAGVGAPTVYSKQLESRLEILDDPTNKMGSGGTAQDFVQYFRDRFERISKMLSQRLDARNAVSIAEGFEAQPNEKVKIIAMVMEKRQKERKIFIQIEDLENTATVLVPEGASRELLGLAQKIPLDQVLCIEATRGRDTLFIAQDFILPDIPEKKVDLTEEPVNVVLLSDIHVGSRTFLEEPFRRLILWLNGKVGTLAEKEIAARTKYVIIAGDLVDGVGVYPRQEDELAIPDVYEQYRLAARFIEQIPDYVEVVLTPGNHDPVRQALPQPAIPKEFAEPVYESRKIVSLGNPARIRLHGIEFLIYHGRSLDDVIASAPNMNFQMPEKAMELLLKCRHLAPEYGKRTSIAPERNDFLIIEQPPNVFHSGHVHVVKHETYRGTLVVNSGAWQSQTEYQKNMGLSPTPGILPVLSLNTMQITTIDFLRHETQESPLKS